MHKGWVYEPWISGYEALLFHNAMQKHKASFQYNPIALAKHEEIGMKYRFLCIATPKNQMVPPAHFAIVELYKPINGMPYLSMILRANFDDMF